VKIKARKTKTRKFRKAGEWLICPLGADELMKYTSVNKNP